MSKGVELTHRNLASNCQQARAWCVEFADGQEIVLGGLPFFHSYGLTAAMNMSIFYGWCNVLIPKPEARAILEAVDKYKVTFIPGVPTLFNAMINHPEIKKFSLASVKECLSGAAPPGSGNHQRIPRTNGNSHFRGLRPHRNLSMHPRYSVRRKGETGLHRSARSQYRRKARGRGRSEQGGHRRLENRVNFVLRALRS